MHSKHVGILVVVGYDIDIGFAIGRLISVFYEMACRLTGDPAKVHFSFTRVGGARCAVLPRDFRNFVEFEPRHPSDAAVATLAAYIREKSIGCIFALDLSVNAGYLHAVRNAGVGRIISYWGAPMSSLNSGVKLLLKRLEVAYLRRAKPDHFIFESQAMRNFAINGRGISAKSTSVVHTGIDAQRFRPDPEKSAVVYERFQIPRSRRIIVYMGHLHTRKGVHVLMRAAGLIVKVARREDIHVLFLGNRGDEIDKFREDVELGSSHITFGGYQDDIPALLAGCYAGCIPSTGWDSFPMSSLEMQACGVPVLVSNWQGVPETVEDGITGIVVPVGNERLLAEAIISLVDDAARRDEMSRAARERIESAFLIEHQISNLVAQMTKQLQY